MEHQGAGQTGERAYLLGLVGKLAGRKILIEGTRVTIGRDATRCEVVLDHAVISRQHAVIEMDQQGRTTIAGVSDKQNVYVNDRAVTRHELRDGDRVGLGPGGVVSFLYHAGGGPTSAAAAGLTHPSPPRAPGRDDGKTFPPQGSAPAPSATTVLSAATLPMLRLGRAPDNDVVLDAPGVSRYHATLTYDGDGRPELSDLGSTNGTFVNGELLSGARRLAPHDVVSLGGFLLCVDGRSIRQHNLSASRLVARKISKELGGKMILKDISLALYPCEFVGLMGPSGCGKSTLMDALNGLRPASAGSVHVNDLDLYRNFDALRRSIGYVPQRDILHDALSVERTLYYTAKLRLPEATPTAAARQIIDEVIETVGLSEQRRTPFRQLSGGQQKRLSLGLELITKPSFIFLDEPTSPLDPETTENMMLLFRRLADEGRIVVMVTHKFEKFEAMHQIAMLTRGGRLAYFGPPREALTYFDCREPGDIYRRIGAREPDDLSRDYHASPQFARYVNARLAETEELLRTAAAPASDGVAAGKEKAERRVGLGQWLTLTRRYLEIKLKDRRNTLLLLAQAPIVALILALITAGTLNDAKTLFIAAIISIWFGANNAVREIVSEAPIYLRERLVNLKVPSYVLSKFFVLSGVGLIQCLLFAGILVVAGRLGRGDLAAVTLILYLTLLAGVAMGLFFSALVNSTEKAMSILPLILIPQLLLGGFLKPVADLYTNRNTGKAATAADYERFEKAKNQPADSAAPASPGSGPDPVVKFEGLGGARPFSALMVARWSIDALAHQVSIADSEAREKLPTQMTVAEYMPRGGEAEGVDQTYRRRVAEDLAILAAFSLVFLSLAMWALKRKDVL